MLRGSLARYVHEAHLHAGKGHWMELEDAVALEWMAGFTRDATPDRIVWWQDDVTHTRFYWLAVPPGEEKKGTHVSARLRGQKIELVHQQPMTLIILLNDDMLDLDKPVQVAAGDTILFDGQVVRTIGTMSRTLGERGDPELVFSAEITVLLP